MKQSAHSVAIFLQNLSQDSITAIPWPIRSAFVVNIAQFLCERPQHGFYCRQYSWKNDLSASEYKHILRIAGKDVEGGKKLLVALSEIKGVGYNYAQVLTQSLNLNPNIRVGFLNDTEIREIEQAIVN